MKRTVRNFTKIRRNVRIAFLEKYKNLCALAFAGNVKHTSWKLQPGRELVEKLRKEVGFKNTTASCDIFYTTYCLWKDQQARHNGNK